MQLKKTTDGNRHDSVDDQSDLGDSSTNDTPKIKKIDNLVRIVEIHEIVEIHDLPAISFNAAQTALNMFGTSKYLTPNPLMRGLVVTPDPSDPSKTELHVHLYIRLLNQLIWLNQRLIGRRDETGAPLIVPKVTDTAPINSTRNLMDYGAEMEKTWGDLSCVVLPQDMDLVDPHIQESPYTQEREKCWLACLMRFSPRCLRYVKLVIIPN